MAATRSLFRRALRVAAACVPEQQGFAFTYIRERFRDPSVVPGSHAHAERVRDGTDEVERMVVALRAKDRLSEAAVSRLMGIQPPSMSTISASSDPSLPSTRSDEAAVAEWLKSLDLDAHVEAFAKARVDGRFLLSLDDDDLQELGVQSRLQRKLILTRLSSVR